MEGGGFTASQLGSLELRMFRKDNAHLGLVPEKLSVGHATRTKRSSAQAVNGRSAKAARRQQCCRRSIEFWVASEDTTAEYASYCSSGNEPASQQRHGREISDLVASAKRTSESNGLQLMEPQTATGLAD